MSNEIFDKFTPNARKVLTCAQELAESDANIITTEYLLLAIVKVAGTLSHDLLREYSINFDQIKLLLSIDLIKETSKARQDISDNAKEALKQAFRVAAQYNHFEVDTEHILLSLICSPKYKSYQLVRKVGLDPIQLEQQLTNIFRDLAEMDQLIQKQMNAQNILNDHFQQEEFEPNPFSPSMPQMGFPPQMMTQKTKNAQTKTLDYFATNLVESARKNEIDPIYGREQEIQRAVQILLRRSKNNPVFVGEPGVGKTAIVEGLASRIARGDVPSRLLSKKIFQLDLGLLIAGTMYRGQFEERLKKVLREVKEDKDIILFIDEIHSIVGTGAAEGSMDAANLLKPALSKGEIRLIGATTLEEYRKYIEKDSAFERRLQPIIVGEPSVAQTIKILKEIAPVYEKHHRIKITDKAILAAATLSKKYINDRFLPDKAIDLLDEAAASKSLSTQDPDKKKQLVGLQGEIDKVVALKERLISEEQFEAAARAKTEEIRLKKKQADLLGGAPAQINKSITDEEIAEIVAQITSIPVGNLKEEESKKFLAVESELSTHIAGQKEAIKQIAQALKRNRAGISTSDKPIGSFVFLGPSGVGKTEVARVLAKQIYGRESALIKIDMSEFMERHNVSQLVGAPPGYVGYDEAGKLTEKVRRNPYSIILLDEIEKAHPEVANILLQILDEGTLTDSKGKKVDFTNTIIIMTSNIGIEEYKKIAKIGFDLGGEAGENSDSMREILSDRLFDIFRPELINRIDRIIIFDPLKKAELAKIAQIQLNHLKDRLGSRKIGLDYDSKVIDKIVKSCNDPIFGARPLIREISANIEDLLSEEILKGKWHENQKVKLGIKKGKYIVTRVN